MGGCRRLLGSFTETTEKFRRKGKRKGKMPTVYHSYKGTNLQAENKIGVCKDLDLDPWTRGEDKPIDKINN